MAEMDENNIAGLERRTRPRRWIFFRRSLAQRLEAASQLVAAASTSERAEEALQRVWQASASEGALELLGCIAQAVPTLNPAQWVPLLVKVLELTSSRNRAADVRAIAVKVLKELADSATEELVVRISQSGDEGASWALYVLREVGLQSASGKLIPAFAGASPEQREFLVKRLARLCDESWDDLLARLAAVVKRLPPDRRLPDALAERLGRKKLEEKCVQMWTHGKSSNARTVLERYFGYDKTLLT